MYTIDLNSDLAESFGAYTIGMDTKILPLVSSANLACGFHASDPTVMSKAVDACKKNHVAVGAHPGYPDLQGFGRRNMIIPNQDVKAMVQYQVGALMAFCKVNNIRMQHVKPHGALYNMAAKDYDLALAICEGIAEIDDRLMIMAQAGSKVEQAAKTVGIVMVKEVFADRAYEEDGSLVARTKPGAMITDENLAMERVITMIKQGKTTSITGKEIPIQADSVCVHGDGEKALQFIQKLREAFVEENICVKNFA